MNIENIADIEKLIRLDRQDASYKKLLFEALLDMDVYILASTEYVANSNDPDLIPANESRPPDAEDTHLAITLWEDQDGNAAIPFFSSIDILQNAIEKEETYVRLNAVELFELTQGSSLVLNPVSEYSRSFSPDDVQDILKLSN
ncbi:MAG: SseB family protein [Alphaproteobacteria bacterium]|nr:SseB family protein [Alphaproteobacteria bacterium]